jgi:flagellar basal body-associated protein FliL
MIDPIRPKIQHYINFYFRSKDYTYLCDDRNAENMQATIADRINEFLDEKGKEKIVSKVYFSQYIFTDR